MYKTIKGVYRKGQIVPLEKVDLEQDKVNIIITFLDNERTMEENQSSAHELLYTIGDRAVEGKFTDASVRHDHYLYSRGQEK
jgi:predicted DNA-binding antitoxin AbrB/MazE fold protein